MAGLAGIHPPSPSGICRKECCLGTAPPRPHSHHLKWRPIRKDFGHSSQRLLCKLSNGPVLLEKYHSPSLFLSCIFRSPPQEVGTCVLPKRFVLVVASATANSDDFASGHEENGEGGVGCCKGEGKVPPKQPSPEIEPADVVQAQLQALRDNDFVTLFEFASPKNKAHTGPLSRFTEMIQGRAYSMMLGHKSAEVLSTLSVAPERFQQRVRITSSNGKRAIFSWSLSRQETDPFQDCWMTDSVHRDE